MSSISTESASKHCWFELIDFPSPVLKEPIDYRGPITRGGRNLVYLYGDSATEEAHRWFRNYGLDLKLISMFWRLTPRNSAVMHVDRVKETDRRIVCGFNVELRGRGVMKWFSEDNLTWTDTFDAYRLYDEGQYAPEIDRCDFSTGPCLVRTDIPHSVEVVKWPRLVCSVRVCYEDGSVLTSWEELVQRVSPSLRPR